MRSSWVFGTASAHAALLRARRASYLASHVSFRDVGLLGSLPGSVGVAFDDEVVRGAVEPVDGGLGEERVGHE